MLAMLMPARRPTRGKMKENKTYVCGPLRALSRRAEPRADGGLASPPRAEVFVMPRVVVSMCLLNEEIFSARTGSNSTWKVTNGVHKGVFRRLECRPFVDRCRW